MSVHDHPTHKGWYHVRYRPYKREGKEAVYTIKTSREDAEEYDNELKRSARPTQESLLFPTVSDTVADYIRYYSLDHLDTTNVKRNLRKWHPYVGNLRFSDISGDHVEQFKHDRLEDGIKPVSINKELSSLSGLVKWAAKKGYCHKPDYFERFSAKKTKSPLPDVPTREEVLALINCMIWPRCGLFACLYFGGLRASEAKGLCAEHVHLEQNYMIVRGKGNKERPVPVVDELRPWLEKRIKEVGSGLLWTTRNGKCLDDLDKVIEWACKRAGITRRMYPHLLRHAFGTHATMGGVGIRTLQYAMGHATSTTTEIYTTLSSNAIIEEITGKFGKG